MGGMSGGMGGMGRMGRSAGTMPPTMGMMMLSRIIMYFAGDPDSWDKRSIMIGMMGGMMGGMGGGMGGMGGGMGGGMMGGMGGGGMRSVPPTELPSALLAPGQTRRLPTRAFSLSSPDLGSGLSLPGRDEPLEIVGDVAQVVANRLVQKAVPRLSAAKAPTSLSQLVMWSLAADLDWSTIAELSQSWANPYELALAKSFVDHLDSLSARESGRLLVQVNAQDPASEPAAAELKQALRGLTMLGLSTQVGTIPPRPEQPVVACRIYLKAGEATVHVATSDATAQNWSRFGKFTLPAAAAKGNFQVWPFADGLAEGLLSRLVRAQVLKGSPLKDKAQNRMVYEVRIDNASPLILNGIAVRGMTEKADQQPEVLSMISVSPRKSLSIPMDEDVVKKLGLKKGIKVLAVDLSGL
jgi:hypothetical protein